SLSGSLPHHVPRLFVVAEAEKPRLPQSSLARPLGETDLRDQLGSHPVRSARDGPRVDERRLESVQRAKPGAEWAQRFGAVAGSDLARITEPTLLVVADEERPEVRAAAGRIRVAADDQLLLPRALQLQPVPRATRGVRRIGALGDQALPARPACLGEATLRVAAPRFAHLQPDARPQRLRQPGAALAQRPTGEVLAVELEQVEDAVDDRELGYEIGGRRP